MDLSAVALLLSITIDIDPDIGTIFGLTITWHGLFTAIGIICGVTLSVYLARVDGVPSDVGQEIALVSVVSAIVGARLFFVFEHWDRFENDLAAIVTDITEGGITLYGGLIGGVLGGVIYGAFHRWPIGICLDAAAPGMILGQGLGRIGDLINGEHLATASDLPWAFVYVHPNTLAELGQSVHPAAGGYELVGDFVILAVLLFVARRFIKIPGWTFCLYMILYSVMRFGLSEFRIDEQTIDGIPVPQIVAAVIIGLAFILAGVIRRFPGQITEAWEDRVLGPPPEQATEDDSAPSPA
ncbi:MAG: prolipoprotein diacylglyceryl transferase [Dehalococcoidia bacterium]|nr:prolipoprotein diacylglyceryl transferase [Dehalococcoidia bacterium]MYA53109.1 prolipoprotein diacylglyceryl transferase [Dehalococcoidia bacterium]